ncbi:c-type cytochrome [Noviherbaspirillum sp. CPCC 100848]|uniref:C-type cytochrome n=1 Tax=Noviherbaspirillum album TaxID=3080276 RepID=A0ABU6JGL5_9BURK|nr:c-type cytochrome [Noviherbaspirillum sp. CPCC 100848]MEC4722806.1 c-type cytochrome [Noviherbaspirillum sp. CPCC 100848]
MKRVSTLIYICFTVVPMAAWSSNDLAKAKNCMACHSIDKEILGPSFKDISKKYTGQKDAEAQIASSITQGSKGRWGRIPMLPDSRVTEDDAASLAKWIMAIDSYTAR